MDSVTEYLTTMSMGGMLMTMTMTSTLSTASVTAGMSSATATSTASSTSTSTSTDMTMDMSTMNQYFTTKFTDYPVIFKTMTLSTGGKAFGIFVFLFFLSFIFKGLSFLSSYLEQKIFHNYLNAVIVEVEDNCECGPDEVSSEESISKNGINQSSSNVSKVRQFFLPGKEEIIKDLIRLLLAFLTSMIGYTLMILAMSYVILYFFAVVLGYAFGEVFFNRLAIVLKVNKNGGSLH